VSHETDLVLEIAVISVVAHGAALLIASIVF